MNEKAKDGQECNNIKCVHNVGGKCTYKSGCDQVKAQVLTHEKKV